MPKIQGAEILDALSKIKEPATLTEIVRYVASCYDEPNDRIEQLVQAALTAGVRYGFVQKHRDLYYAIKDAQKALDEDADGSDEEEDDDENDDIENDNDNEDMDSAASGESFCSCGDNTLEPLSPAMIKLAKDGVIAPSSKGKDPSRRESRHDTRAVKKHDSKHGVDKKKGAVARQNDDDERNSGDEEEDDENYSDDDAKHASTCPRDCAACAARKRAAAARRRKRKGRSRSRSRRRRI